jgi:5S rRNA maturation endonuclease (ribonuclease M5)
MIERVDFIKLKAIIEEIIFRSENGVAIIVEGLKDIASLKALGIKGEIITSSNSPDVEIVDKVGNKDVIILTDWDRRGELLEKSLVSKFTSWGVTPDTVIRKKIFAIVSKDVTSIENLANYYKKVEEYFNRDL